MNQTQKKTCEHKEVLVIEYYCLLSNYRVCPAEKTRLRVDVSRFVALHLQNLLIVTQNLLIFPDTPFKDTG